MAMARRHLDGDTTAVRGSDILKIVDPMILSGQKELLPACAIRITPYP
jgi:hypothetical protein